MCFGFLFKNAIFSSPNFNSFAELSMNQLDLKLDREKNNENKLIHYLFKVGLKFDVVDNIKLEVFSGYYFNRFDQYIDFSDLPLSLRLSKNTHSSWLGGINFGIDAFSAGDFSFHIKPEFIFFKSTTKDFVIVTDIFSGNSKVKHHSYSLKIDFILHYDRLVGITPYAGTMFYFNKGGFDVTETIDNFEFATALNYKQQNYLGILLGAYIELSSQWLLQIKTTFFSLKSIAISIHYET
jgi:hypothetical protein